jgi:hypothetical protein
MKKSTPILVFSLVFGSLVLPATVWAVDPLYNPEPLKIPCANLNMDKARATIRDSILRRKWLPTDKGKGVMEATYDIRKHQAVVTITYDTKTVKIKYKSSVNLDYKEQDGQQYIHFNYNRWIKNMEQDLKVFLSKACG